MGLGCGINNNNGGTIRVTSSVISGNGGLFSGGGIYNSKGSSATLTDTIVSHNSMQYGYEYPGGGIFNGGSLTLVGSTVSDHKGATVGGGIYNSSTGTATLIRSTISNNRAYFEYSPYTRGGGIDNRGKLTSHQQHRFKQRDSRRGYRCIWSGRVQPRHLDHR